ncbi:hypothetical protein ACHAQF_000535 [Verticillium nonalfalfae]
MAPGISLEEPKDGSYSRSACSECQRRKQKCNREWPCNHCQKRKVADKCQFNPDPPPISAWTPSTEVKRKREQSYAETENDDEFDDGEGIDAVGYTASHLFANLGLGPDVDGKKSKTPKQYYLDPKTSPQLQRALQTLPPRPYIDSMIQNFLSNVNYYYYIVYPPNFLTEYHEWWADRAANRPLGLPWTCLLIMVCACSVQHTDAEMGASLEADLGRTVQQLTDLYHDAARELHSAIPVGNTHMFTVQYLLHSCYWFKAEARFVECWHVLGAAIREGQNLDLHREATGIPDFEREMRRRLWCLLDAWDWLVSALLARPMLIDRSDCDVGLPSLTLEDYPTSPLLHMKLQSELVARIFKRFGPPKYLTDPNDIFEYQDILESWMQTFPPSYAFVDTDRQQEVKYPWIALHRHYVHTIAFSVTLGPLRPHMAKTVTKDTPEVELTLRSNGVKYALKLMGAVHEFFEYVWSRDTTFHFVPFCIFDTATLLVSAVLHDEAGTLPRKDEVTKAIDLALHTLKRLTTATETAKTPYDILRRLSSKLPRAHGALRGADTNQRKKLKVLEAPLAVPPAQQQQPAVAGFTYGTDPNQFPGYMYPPSEDSGIGNGGTGSNNTHSPATASSSDGSGLATVYPNANGNGHIHHHHQQPHQMNGHPQAGPPQVGLPQVGPPQVVPGQYADSWAMPNVELPAQPAGMPMQDMGYGMITDAELANLGDLGTMWHWQGLNLDFTGNTMM